MKMSYIVILLALITLCSNNASAELKSDSMEKIVTTDWLQKNINDPKLVILHFGKNEDFEKEHIGDARIISVRELIINIEDGLSHELPGDAKIESVIKSWGVNNDSKIVICYSDEIAMLMSARLFMTLDYAGLGNQTSILNGGLIQWKNEERAVTSDVSEYKPGNFKMNVNKNVLADKKWMIENFRDHNVMIVDARPEEQYSGTGEDDNSERKGHIEGAINIPFFSIQNEDESFLYKDKSELKKLFKENYVPDNATVITYCGSGIWAAPVYFAARALGYNTKFYDGSFQEWGKDESLPITGPVSAEN